MDKITNAIIYPGTFDPITNGHLDLIERAAHMYQKIVVAVAASSEKHPLFSLAERVALVEQSIQQSSWYQKLCSNHNDSGHKPSVDIQIHGFDGLLVDFARQHRIATILRGLRAVSDFEYELQQAHTNRSLAADIETIFLMTSTQYSYLSSSIVRLVASYHGDISSLVSPNVTAALKKKFPQAITTVNGE